MSRTNRVPLARGLDSASTRACSLTIDAPKKFESRSCAIYTLSIRFRSYPAREMPAPSPRALDAIDGTEGRKASSSSPVSTLSAEIKIVVAPFYGARSLLHARESLSMFLPRGSSPLFTPPIWNLPSRFGFLSVATLRVSKVACKFNQRS